MALLKFNKLLEDLETGSKIVFTGTVKNASESTLATVATLATSAGVAGSAAYSGTAYTIPSIHGGAGTHAY